VRGIRWEYPRVKSENHMIIWLETMLAASREFMTLYPYRLLLKNENVRLCLVLNNSGKSVGISPNNRCEGGSWTPKYFV
jgi:hypothetical protein